MTFPERRTRARIGGLGQRVRKTDTSEPSHSMHVVMSDFLAFRVNLPYIIQSVRLLHALLEAELDVRIPRFHHRKLRRLEEVFNISLNGNVEGVPLLPDVQVHHGERPRTQVGSIQRPLIFAHEMVDHCRNLWPKNREVEACFAGRFHEDRREVLRKWLHRQYPDAQARMPDQSAIDGRIRLRRRVKRLCSRVLRGPLRSLQSYIEVPPLERRSVFKNVVLMTSDRGWTYPIKAWDSEYFRLLASSKFVLCPNGKFTWTYRFFEAVLCGAIPIVQDNCSLYDGFRYHKMDKPLDKIRWNTEDAEFNAELARQRLTVSQDALISEIERLLKDEMAPKLE